MKRNGDGQGNSNKQLSIQKVDGDAPFAEESFYKYQRKPVAIDDTESILFAVAESPTHNH